MRLNISARRPSAVPTNSNVLLSGSSQEGQQLLHDSNTTGLNLAVAGETYSHVNNDQHESRVILDVHSERIYGGPLYLPPSNQEGVPYNRKRCLSTLHDTNIVEELNQVTPKRGRYVLQHILVYLQLLISFLLTKHCV